MELINLILNTKASSGAKVTLKIRLSFGLRNISLGSIRNGRSTSNHVSTLSFPVLPLNKVTSLTSIEVNCNY